MKENLCSAYMKDAGNDKQYYEIFFEMCRKFRIDWATADEKEKGFVTEVTPGDLRARTRCAGGRFT